MTAEQLEKLGRACFGANWQNEMGRALECGARRIRYFMNGTPIPDAIHKKALCVALARIVIIREAHADLCRQAPSRPD